MKKNQYITFIIIFIAIGVFGAIIPHWILYLLTIALCKGLIATGVMLLLRAGLVTFGQGLYSAAAAYSIAIVAKYLGINDILLAIPLGILGSMIFSLAIGLIISRYREIFFAMITIASSMVFYGLLKKAYHFTGGTDGLSLPIPTFCGASLPQGFERLGLYFITLFVIVIVIITFQKIMCSPYGYLLQCIKGNEIRVSYSGIHVNKMILRTYMISGFFAGLGGSLLAINVGHVDPSLSFWSTSGEFVVISLLAGVININFAFVSAVFLEFLKSYAFSYSPYLWQIVIGSTMLLIIVFKPGGLWQLYHEFEGKYLTTVKNRFLNLNKIETK